MAKDSYEISIWRDVLTNGHYEEAKIAVIGADNLHASCLAAEPKLVEGVNGTNTFTFKMFYRCRDLDFKDVYATLSVTDPALLEESQHLLLVYHDLENVASAGYDNPFVQYLANERKIKVKWREKWYDLIIKNCQEDSSGKSITYTCTDSYINELAKTGFSLEFDNELENNQGTITALGAKILDGSDWTIDTASCDTILQEVEEPVFGLHISSALSCVNDKTGTTETIPSGALILLYYQQVADLMDGTITSSSQKFQLAYAASYTTDANSQLVNNATCYTTSNALSWSKSGTTITINGWAIDFDTGVSSTYRAKRLSRTQKMVLDPLTGKYCDLYQATVSGATHDVYHYTDVNKDDAITVVNVLANTSNFSNTSGWEMASTAFTLYPALSGDLSSYSANSYLKILHTSSITNYNSGITSCSSYLPDGLQIGTQYVLRYRAREDSSGAPSSSYFTDDGTDNTLNAYLGKYTTDSEGVKTFSQSIASFGSIYSEGSNWYHRIVTITTSVSRTELYNQSIGFFINPTETIWLEEIQFFKYVLASDGTTMILPGQLALTAESATRHNYYDHTLYGSLTDAADIQFIYQGTDSAVPSGLTAVYNDNFEKIRSITGKQSNRFNLLQTLAEQFECWVRFKINHNSNGTLIYNSDGTPQKYVYFKTTIGEERNIGFVYGIDLKTIQRTVQSDNIVTKTIVNPNTNEYAKNGFCDISRASNNYSKSDSIYNFDYYISTGLLDGAEVTKDLYQKTSGALGYYAYLHDYHTQYNDNATKISQLEAEKTSLETYKDLYSATITSANEMITSAKANICTAAGLDEATSLASATAYFQNHSGSDQVKAYLVSWQTAEQEKTSATTSYNQCVSGLTSINSQLTTLYTSQTTLLTSIKTLEYNFYKKYSRFIQEGSWQDNDYIDDNLYYIDAVSLAYRSARPQISYNISVLRLSALEDYENKVFHLGDITYIQDREFFGMETIDGIPTPIKEKVIVSQLTSNFEEPDKDSFQVQNYKSAFDDLFQRVTAATQSLQFSEGDYARAANAVEGDGSITPEAIQSAFDNNKSLAMSATNDAVVQDANGITLSSLDDPSRKVRVNSNGIFISTDGGNTWKNAIRSGGVATEALTAGKIDTETISIYQGNAPTFRWDFNGISAFAKNNNGTINTSKFVRFDSYGIYGLESSDASWVPDSETAIWNNAKFGLTWTGLFIKNKTSSGMVEVSSTNDIQVIKNNCTRIKIGNLGTSAAPEYGMLINDSTGNPVLLANDDGTLWLEKLLSVGDGRTSLTKIGYGTATRTGTSYHEVINGDGAFIVYEDGYIKATAGEIGGCNIVGGVLTIGSSNISTGAVTEAKLGDDVVQVLESKNKTWAQATAPSGGVTAGDLWINTNEGNKLYRWNGSEWEPYQDTAIAGAKVSANQQLYYTTNSSTAPTAPATWVTSTSTAANVWTTVVPSPNAGYKYYSCYQVKLADNTISTSNVVTVDAQNTILEWCSSSDVTKIDGGNIYAHSVTASEIAANTITANEINTSSIQSAVVTASYINALSIEAGSLLVKDTSNNTLFSAGGNAVQIANFTVNRTASGGAMYSGPSSLSTTTVGGVYIGTDGIVVSAGSAVSGNPYVRLTAATGLLEANNLQATGGTIGGWTIDTTKLCSIGSSTYDGSGIYSGSGWQIYTQNTSTRTIGDRAESTDSDYNTTTHSSVRFFTGSNSDPRNGSFKVTADGTIVALQGYIGGFTIGDNGLSCTVADTLLTLGDGTSGLFTVNGNGVLSAQNAKIQGSITTDQVRFSNISGVISGNINGASEIINIAATITILSGQGTGGTDQLSITLTRTKNGSAYRGTETQDVDLSLFITGQRRPSHTYYVSKDYHFSRTFAVDQWQIQFTVETNLYSVAETSHQVYPSSVNVNVGAVQVNTHFIPSTTSSFDLGSSSNLWDDVFAVNNAAASSDRKSKKDIQSNLQIYSQLFDKLQPVSFKYIENTSNRTHLGLIAQDIEQSLTECGLTSLDFAGLIKSLKDESKDKLESELTDADYTYGIRYGELHAMEIYEIQQLKARVSQLESRLASLEAPT